MEFSIFEIIKNGGPGMVAIVFMFMVWMQNKKKSLSNEEVADKLIFLTDEIDSAKDLCIKIWDSHNVKDADGVYVWHLRQSMVEEQKETKRVLQDLHLAIRDIHQGQERQTIVLEKLIDKIIGMK